MHQRAHDRYSPRSTIQIVNTLDGKVLGVLVNISREGFMIVSEGEHPGPGTIHQLQLQNNEKTVPDITLGATCLWQEEASASNSYWCGFQIIDISSRDRETLDGYIKSLKDSI